MRDIHENVNNVTPGLLLLFNPILMQFDHQNGHPHDDVDMPAAVPLKSAHPTLDPTSPPSAFENRMLPCRSFGSNCRIFGQNCP